METKKKNFFDNFRTKLPKKKPQKKLLAKQGRNLAHRRSISVPDLTLTLPQAEACSTESVTDAVYFGISPSQSDSDSVASVPMAEGPVSADKHSDSVPEITYRVPHNPPPASNRMSAPVETQSLYEEINDMMSFSREKKVNVAQEGLYAQVDKRARRNAQQFIFEPTPAPRHIFQNAQASSPKPDLVDRVSLSGEDPPTDRVLSETVVAALARANSMGEQTNPYEEKKPLSVEQKKPSSGALSAIREYPSVDRMSLVLDSQGHMENSDRTSLESTCDSPTDEQVNTLWTDSEEQEREPLTPFILRQFSIEESVPEEDPLDYTVDVSIIMYVTTCMDACYQ